MRKRGFTLVEFTCSLVVMFLLVAFSVPILFKKQKKPKEYEKTNGEYICYCDTSKNDGGKSYCDFTFSNSSISEFYTIQLTGGGASGGPEKAGNPGEVKVLYLPAMNGTYRIQLGKGGTSITSNGGTHGGITALYKLNDDGTYRLIDYARGGISNNETIEDTSIDTSTEGALPALNSGTGNCGKGGNAKSVGNNTAGTMGEGVIRW